MTRKKPKHTRIRNGRLYYEPTKRMRASGAVSRPLGPDRDEARAVAEDLNTQWQILRQGPAASDEAIEAAGWALEQADVVKAWATVRQIRVLAARFEHSSAAVCLARQMRRIARELDQAAKEAAQFANQSHRDFLHVAS